VNTKSRIIWMLAAVSVAISVQAGTGHGHEAPAGAVDSAFHAAMDHYEAIRQALVQDQLGGIADHAGALAEMAAALPGKFTAPAPGRGSEPLSECLALMPAVRLAAVSLEGADTLAEAREAFSALSKPMIRWRDMAAGEHRPVVVHCPMVDDSWLQPAGEIGNPYKGQAMARCGEVVRS